MPGKTGCAGIGAVRLSFTGGGKYGSDWGAFKGRRKPLQSAPNYPAGMDSELLAVDDTVHFMHNFRRYYAETKDVTESVRKTLHTAGRAMLVTSIILSIGFFLFMFASMQNIVRFGLFTGITVILALMADFFTVPALMVLIHPSKGKNDTG